MSNSLEEEGVVPSSMEHFVAHAKRPWSCLKDVDGELSDDGEVLRAMILATAAGILVEQHIEDPVKVVLDTPVSAGDVEQLLGRQRARSYEVSHFGLGWFAGDLAPALDASDGNQVGEVVLQAELRGGHDHGLPSLDAAVRSGCSLSRTLRSSGGIDQSLGVVEEMASIALDGQHIVAFAVADSLGDVGAEMQGIGRDNSAFQIEQSQHFERAGDLVAVRRLPLGQRHAGASRPDVDHVQIGR